MVRGRVQGVGFRFFACDSARRLGLCGYVRNLSDGRAVEVAAQAEPWALDSFAATLRRIPPGSTVSEVTFFVIPPEPTATTFDIVG